MPNALACRGRPFRNGSWTKACQSWTKRWPYAGCSSVSADMLCRGEEPRHACPAGAAPQRRLMPAFGAALVVLGLVYICTAWYERQLVTDIAIGMAIQALGLILQGAAGLFEKASGHRRLWRRKFRPVYLCARQPFGDSSDARIPAPLFQLWCADAGRVLSGLQGCQRMVLVENARLRPRSGLRCVGLGSEKGRAASKMPRAPCFSFKGAGVPLQQQLQRAAGGPALRMGRAANLRRRAAHCPVKAWLSTAGCAGCKAFFAPGLWPIAQPHEAAFFPRPARAALATHEGWKVPDTGRRRSGLPPQRQTLSAPLRKRRRTQTRRPHRCFSGSGPAFHNLPASSHPEKGVLHAPFSIFPAPASGDLLAADKNAGTAPGRSPSALSLLYSKACCPLRPLLPVIVPPVQWPVCP